MDAVDDPVGIGPLDGHYLSFDGLAADDRHAADYDHPDVIVPEGATTAVGLLANHSRTGIDAATHPVSVDDRIAGLRRPIHLPVVPGVFERAGCR
ncbi:hypothetical protein BRD17_04675 [Halobacteriales archaeon SW_7_68_16]|nr:MAG: hypothetical protein BRD17_04675 [Halobacteriales archaeon SW_7_68_16]